MADRKRGAAPATADVGDVEELLDLADDNAHQVWFYRERGGAWPFLGKIGPAALRTAGIQEFARARWGGGQFRAKLRHVKGTWVVSRTFAIEGDAIETRHEDARPLETRASPATGLPAWVETLGITIATAIAKRFLEKPEPDPLLLELLKQQRGGIDPLSLQETIAAAEKRGEDRGREFGALKAQVDHKGSSNGNGGVVGAIERNVPELLRVFNRKLSLDERRIRAPASAPTSDMPTTANHEDSQNVPTSTVPSDPLVAMLLGVPMPARHFLFDAAQGDENPEIYAGMILSKLEDEQYAQMPAFLARTDFVDLFVQTYPPFADVREWVERLAQAMRETLALSTDTADAASSPTNTAAPHAPA